MERQKTANLRLNMPSWMRFGTGIAPHDSQVATPSRANTGEARVTQNDPTDHALAAIASILDKPESSDTPRESSGESTELRLAEEILAAPQTSPAAPPPPLSPDELSETPAAAASSGEIYSRIGPGPLAAIRFKWTARPDENGDYFVDETIGENSAPITTGPMSREAAVRLVDDRERYARQRFEELRSQMAGGEVGR
jgi:hypothetical protein